MSFELLPEAVLSGVLLGCFYAAVSLGLAIAFGLIDVPHLAHPTFVVLGAFGAYLLGTQGWDPIVSGVAMAPLFFLAGVGLYRFYHVTFERRGADTALRGLAFFFGMSFVVEAMLMLAFGVDQRLVEAPYIGESLPLGDMRVPMRMVAAFGAGLALTIALTVYLSRTFTGRALRAVAQDEGALVLLGANPVKIKGIGFGIATAVAAIAGALLIIVGPVDPGTGRLYIGRTFCIVVLAGMGSIPGTLVAALIVGIAETVVLASLGASWAGAVSFGILLLVLAFKPSGLFGR